MAAKDGAGAGRGAVLALAALVFLALGARLWQLDDIPAGLYVDEASIGINAVSILETGRDEHGRLLPLYFRAFGEYKNPIYVYSTAALFGLFGASGFVLRLTSVLFFAGGLILGLALVARLFPRDRAVLLFAALSFGFLPSLFVLSRVAFEVLSSFPWAMAVLLAVHATFCGDGPARHPAGRAALLGLLLGTWLYTYSTIRMTAALTLAAVVVLFASRRNLPALRLTTVVFLLCTVPMAVLLVTEPTALLGRFKAISYLDEPIPLADKLALFLRVYAVHWSPDYLLLDGDANLRHGIGSRGAVFVVTLVLAAIGAGAILVGAHGLRSRFSVLLMLLALAAPLPAAMTSEDVPNSIRAHLMGPLLVLLSCYGFVAIRRWWAGRGRRHVAALAMTGVLAVEAASFVALYFTVYPQRSVPWMGSLGIDRTVEAALAERPSRLVFVPHSGGSYANFRFALIEAGMPAGTEAVVEQAPTYRPGTCLIHYPEVQAEFPGFPEPRLVYRPAFSLGPLGRAEGGPVPSLLGLRCY